MLVDLLRVSRNDGRVNAECRLVTYGTLGPGRPNHHQLDGLDGRWLKDTSTGCSSTPAGARALATQHWSFKPTVRQSMSRFSSQPTCQITGHASTTSRATDQRVVTTVRTPTGEMDAFIYVQAQAQN